MPILISYTVIAKAKLKVKKKRQYNQRFLYFLLIICMQRFFLFDLSPSPLHLVPPISRFSISPNLFINASRYCRIRSFALAYGTGMCFCFP
ncbi:hypothetical protein VNO77_01642 [Canavalia gladiata]|uniref:Uncharacterized protein n=1 Tax=Canavalia gladiata TaxID=3824 RepID=A0AAN9MRI7_CANGL